MKRKKKKTKQTLTDSPLVGDFLTKDMKSDQQKIHVSNCDKVDLDSLV